MKRLIPTCLLFLTAAIATGVPLTVQNPSFEDQTPDLTTGQFTNNLEPAWKETGGPNNANGFIEALGFATSNGTDTLGMALGHDVWQDLADTFQPATLYTLTVMTGNRTGQTITGNQSTYALGAPDGQIAGSAVHNATGRAANTFADAPTLTFDTFTDPGVVGQNIRILLRARGAGRSHFDNVRLDAAASLQNGRPTGTLSPATGITLTSATMNGTVTSIGSAAPSVRFYWGTVDGGNVIAAWQNNAALAGTQTGAFSRALTGLTAGTRYYYRAWLSNASGITWASPSQTFDTPVFLPTLENTGATVNSPTSVRLGAKVITTGGVVPSVTIYYGPADGGTTTAAWASSFNPGPLASTLGEGATVSGNVSGLTAGATYYFRASATNGAGRAWAPVSGTFTLPVTGPPQIVNRAATNVDLTTVTLEFTVEKTGFLPTTVQVGYGTTDGLGTLAGWASTASAGAGAGNGSVDVSGLSPGTIYYFRAFATNAAGTVAAPETFTFTTDAVRLPSVATRSASGVTATMATLHGEVTGTGDSVPNVFFHWGTTDGGANAAAWANTIPMGPDAGTFSRVLTGLSPLTTYYFRVSATNAAGSVWAASSSQFTTASGTLDRIVINEIHYDPLDRTRRTEYIELHNPTGGAVDVGGWTLTGAVEFVFPAGTSIPAGGYRCVVENVAAFNAFYPAANYPGAVASVIGAWTGGLRNSGETIELRDGSGAIVDEVDYKAGFPWPTMARGAGASMHLLHPGLDNAVGASWVSSALLASSFAPIVTTTGTWRYRPGASAPSSPQEAWTGTTFTEDATWLSGSPALGYGDIDGNGANTDVNTNLTAMQGSYKTLYLRRSFSIANTAALPTSATLRVRCAEGCIVWLNGTELTRYRVPAGAVPAFDAPDGTSTEAAEPLAFETDFTVPNAASLLRFGTNIVAVQVINSATSDDDLNFNLSLSQLISTPGAANGGLLASASAAYPAVRNVEHSPNEPVANTPVIVTATVTDPDGVGSVNLLYQIVNPGSYIRKTDTAYNLPANWITLAMNDAGTGGDAVAGDSIYSATIPASVQTHRRLIRYRIRTTDAPGNVITVPYADDEQPNFAYFCYNGVPEWRGKFRVTAFSGQPATALQTFPVSELNRIRPWHLIANATDVSSSQYVDTSDGVSMHAAVVYDGKVYDHVLFANRGIGSTYQSGKNKWTISFNRARDVHVRDNWGRLYNETWNSMALDANASPWASVHRGAAGVEEASSYRIFELAGVPALRTHYVHWRVIDGAVEAANPGTSTTDPTVGTGDGQFSGDFWGLYLGMEPMETNFINERELPDGNVYSIEGGGAVVKHQGESFPANTTDWNNFSSGVNNTGTGTEAWFRQNTDLKALYTFLAIGRLIGNVDVRPGDNYRFYHRPATPLSDNRWVIMPYDLDMMYIAAHHWGGAMDASVTVAGAPNAIRAISRHPALALEYRNRCREIMSLLASDPAPDGGQIGQLIDEYAQLVNPAGVPLTWADADAAMWNQHPRTAGGGGNTGQTSHKQNFWRANYLDGGRGNLGGTSQTLSWVRTLADANSDGWSDHESQMQWFVNFATNTYPAGTAWSRKAVGTVGAGTDSDPNRQKGYGYKYLEWESLYGGYVNATVNPAITVADTDFPLTPSITYTGAAGYPANDLRFVSSNFCDPNGNNTVAAVQWRIGEISAPGIPGYVSGTPRIYEIEEVWTSAEIATASPTAIAEVRVPASAVRTGHTYRARVRHKDATGRWSAWSAPAQFMASVPEVAVLQSALRISEIMYRPAAPASPAELAVSTDAGEFEFVEIMNTSASALPLTDVRFTKGIDYDFPPGYMIPAGGRVVVGANPAALAARYGGGITIAPGGYSPDRLSNGGEDLKLSFGTGTPIIEFAYDNAAPWPVPPADGYSIVLKAPRTSGLEHSDPAQWRLSCELGGSPAAADGSSYAAWQGSFPGTIDPAADTDGDGASNLLEFALGSNPLLAASNGAPEAALAEGHLTLAFSRPACAEDVAWAVQFSTGLTDWTVPGELVSSTPAGAGMVREVWRSTVPVSANVRSFGRVRVTSP